MIHDEYRSDNMTPEVEIESLVSTETANSQPHP